MTSTSFTGPAPYWQSYGYDLTGNRLSRTDYAIVGTPVAAGETASETFTGTGDVHAVRTVSRGSAVQTFGYDGGRPVSRTGVSGGQPKAADNIAYSWTIDDQLAGLVQGPSGSPTHTYDADGGHVSRTTDGVSTVQLGEDTITVVSGVATKVVREHDFPGGVSTVRTGVPSGSGGTTGATTAQDTDAMHYQAANPQATATTDITADSLTVSRRTYTPFGEDRDAANSGLSFAAERGFLNAPTDDVTGLTTLGARQYDPVLGQFISVDPVADSRDSQQLNGYSYADADPVNNTDPDGRLCANGPDGMCRPSAGFDYTTVPGGVGMHGGNITTPGVSDAQVGAVAYTPTMGRPQVVGHTDQPWGQQAAIAERTMELPQYADPFTKFVAGTLAAGKQLATHPVQSAKTMVESTIDDAAGCAHLDVWDCVSTAATVLPVVGGVSKAAKLSKLSKLAKADDVAGEGAAGSKAASCLNSFTAQTPVTLADGSKLAISKVKTGDKVLATDPITGESKPEQVDRLIRHSGVHAMVLIGLADGSVLRSTNGHQIWTATGHRFTRADHLHVGDKLETSSGSFTTVAALTAYAADLSAYNLQIANIHTYYAGSTPVLVHNSCANPFRGTTMTDSESLKYHYAKHGGGRSIEEYATDAAAFAENPTGAASSVELKDGTMGTRYPTRGGPGGSSTHAAVS